MSVSHNTYLFATIIQLINYICIIYIVYSVLCWTTAPTKKKKYRFFHFFFVILFSCVFFKTEFFFFLVLHRDFVQYHTRTLVVLRARIMLCVRKTKHVTSRDYKVIYIFCYNIIIIFPSLQPVRSVGRLYLYVVHLFSPRPFRTIGHCGRPRRAQP